MGASERFPVSLNAVNIVCFKIDWKERALNVLLLKRSISPQKNKWSLPGGFVQGDETLEEAARRIFVNETNVGSGLTSIDTNNSQIIGIGTTACNNIYKVHQVQYDAGNGIITAFCNIDSNSNVSGINTVGFAFTSVGYYSWGIVTGFSRGSEPIALNVDGNTFSVGLGSYPLFQRRGFGLRGTGGITK